MARAPDESKREVTTSLLSRFPDAPTLTIARKAYNENKALWTNLEACRCYVRNVRGNQGQRMRSTTVDKRFFRKPGKAGEVSWPLLPKPITYLRERDPYVVDTPGRWLIISDIHLPYHDEVALKAALAYAKKLGVVGIILNGDINDFHGISRFDSDPRKRDLNVEIEAACQFRRAIRQMFGAKCRIIDKEGNHDERWILYLMRKAQELLDIPQFQYEELCGLNEIGSEHVGDKRPIRLGKLWVIHGHEYRGGFVSPVNPARGIFLKAKESTLCGHWHQSSSHSSNTIGDHTITCWSMGCLCDRKPEYARFNEWQHGFAVVEIGSDGSYSVQNCRILNGKVWA